MSPFLGKQDIATFLTQAAGQVTSDPNQAWTSPPAAPDSDDPYNRQFLAFAFLLTQPGVPLIYYGDEFGMPGTNDPDNRRMMLLRHALLDARAEPAAAAGDHHRSCARHASGPTTRRETNAVHRRGRLRVCARRRTPTWPSSASTAAARRAACFVTRSAPTRRRRNNAHRSSRRSEHHHHGGRVQHALHPAGGCAVRRAVKPANLADNLTPPKRCALGFPLSFSKERGRNSARCKARRRVKTHTSSERSERTSIASALESSVPLLRF